MNKIYLILCCVLLLQKNVIGMQQQHKTQQITSLQSLLAIKDQSVEYDVFPDVTASYVRNVLFNNSSSLTQEELDRYSHLKEQAFNKPLIDAIIMHITTNKDKEIPTSLESVEQEYFKNTQKFLDNELDTQANIKRCRRCDIVTAAISFAVFAGSIVGFAWKLAHLKKC